MARGIRLRCSCGRVVNAVPNQKCPSCKKLMDVPQGGMIYLYRPFSPRTICKGLAIYLNDSYYGIIGVGECVKIPVDFGEYTMRMETSNATIMDVFFDTSTKLPIDINLKNPEAFVKVWCPYFSTHKIELLHMSADEINRVFNNV